MHPFFTNIERNARLAQACRQANHGMPTDRQLMRLGKHGRAGLAVPGAQHGKLARLIQQEDPGIVKAVSLADDVYGLGQQLVQVKDRSHPLANLVGSMQQSRPALRSFQQILVHAVQMRVGDGNRQLVCHAL